METIPSQNERISRRKEETTKPCPDTILSRKGNDYFLSHCIRTIVSDVTDEERTCLLGGGAGRSPRY